MSNLIQENRSKIEYIISECISFVTPEERVLMFQLVGVFFCIDEKIVKSTEEDQMIKGSIDFLDSMIKIIKRRKENAMQ